VTELANEGTDTVRTTLASYTLGANIENLTGTAAAAQTLTGNTGANQLAGGAGNDTIDGGAGDDTLDGGAGADSLRGSTGNDVFIIDNTGDVVTELAGEGTDTVHASVSITGLAANVENLTLTSAVAINATGNALANFLTGNGSANQLTGGAGNDTLDGGAGTDTLVGGLGDDTFIVDAAGDVATENAGEGTDTVQASVSIASLFANIENLVLTGGTAINGVGNALANVLTGNAANNALTGGGGNDTIDGGAGSDTLVLSGARTNYTITVIDAVQTRIADARPNADGQDVIIGIEQIQFTDGVFALTTLLESGQTLTGTVGADSLMGGTRNDTISGLGGADTLSGGAGQDHIDGGAGSDLARGDDGNDVLLLAASAAGDMDTLEGGAGTDTVDFASFGSAVWVDFSSATEVWTKDGPDVVAGTWREIAQLVAVENVIGSAFADQIRTDGNANLINGGAGNDLIMANGGDDTIQGGLGVDTLDGGSGSDLYIYRAGDGADFFNEETGEITSFDRLHLININPTDVSITRAGVDLLINIIALNQIIEIDEHFYSANFNYGIEEIEFFSGIVWDLPRINAQAANLITSLGTASADTLAGTTAIDVIFGGGGNDSIFGGGGADTLGGDEGNDTLDGGIGSDLLSAGIGNDLVVIQSMPVSELDTVDGGVGTDTIDFSAFNSAVWIDLVSADGTEVWTRDGIDLASGSWRKIAELVRVENANGSIFSDELYGDSGANVFFAAAGNDKLFGRDGNDTLVGGAGDDLLSGGIDNDSFVFAFGFGKDTISDFAAGVGVGDVIEFAGFGASFDSFTEVMAAATQVGSNTVIAFDVSNTITLNNVTRSLLVADDFRFM
jgi:Ca2+-binding RTX toxin-like protein